MVSWNKNIEYKDAISHDKPRLLMYFAFVVFFLLFVLVDGDILGVSLPSSTYQYLESHDITTDEAVLLIYKILPVSAVLLIVIGYVLGVFSRKNSSTDTGNGYAGIIYGVFSVIFTIGTLTAIAVVLFAKKHENDLKIQEMEKQYEIEKKRRLDDFLGNIGDES